LLWLKSGGSGGFAGCFAAACRFPASPQHRCAAFEAIHDMRQPRPGYTH